MVDPEMYGKKAMVRGEEVTVLGGRHLGFRGLGATVLGADTLVEYPGGEVGAVRAEDIDAVEFSVKQGVE